MGVFSQDKEPVVPRALHDQIVRQYENQIRQIERRTERSVTRESHDAVVAGLTNQVSMLQTLLTQFQDQLKTTLTETLAIKRGEMNMADKGFDPASMDAMAGIGPKSVAAIEEWADGDAQLRKQLIQQAQTEALGLRAAGADADELDAEVARRIRAGDSAI